MRGVRGSDEWRSPPPPQLRIIVVYKYAEQVPFESVHDVLRVGEYTSYCKGDRYVTAIAIIILCIYYNNL